MTLSIEQAIAEAERQIREIASAYPGHMLAILDRAESRVAAADWEELVVVAHDIKGQSATVGWPILGDIARSLESCLKSEASELFADAAGLHLRAMRVCLADGITESGGKGSELLGNLGALREHMRAMTKDG